MAVTQTPLAGGGGETINLRATRKQKALIDTRSSHLPNLDPVFADFHLLMPPGMLGLRNAWEPGSPILALVGNKAMISIFDPL